MIDLQVWRLTDSESDYVLIGKKQVMVNTSHQFEHVELNEDEEIEVKKGDCIGFSTMSDNGVIGYVFEEVPLSSAEEYAGLEEGVHLTFDPLLFPYKFSIGVTYRDLGKCVLFFL